MSNIIPVSENQITGPRAHVKKTTTDCFQDSLAKALETKATTESSQHLPALPEIQPNAYLNLETQAEKIVHRTSHLLDLLGRYAEDLDNPAKSLKGIAPLLDTITEKADDLIRETENMGAPDEKLRKIASDVALTARMERIKFNRGDYI